MRVGGLHTVDYSSMVPNQADDTSSIEKKQNTSNATADLQKKMEQQQVTAKLQRIDQKVRAHEMAHLSAAGELARGGASYQYVKGPDGKQYAVGGEVPIDISPGKSPEETVQKMNRVIAAALAPADPSPQDYKIAAKAAQMKLQAQLELSKKAENSTHSVDFYV